MSLVNHLILSGKVDVEVFYIDTSNGQSTNMQVSARRLERMNFKFHEYDVIHTSGIRPDLFAYFNRKKIKYHISTINSYVHTELAYKFDRFASDIIGRIWLRLWNRADKLVCVSSGLRDYYSRWFPFSKMIVIHNGITENDLTGQTEKNITEVTGHSHRSGLKVIGCAGTLNRVKGFDRLLYCIAKSKEFGCVIIGSGKEYKKLYALARKLKIDDRCYFPGFIRNASLNFSLFDLFVVPSHTEGFCLTLIEAVRAKVPVVCSDIKVFRELFTSDEVTFFRSGDIESLSLALRHSSETGRQKVERAFLKFRSNYTDDLMARRYLELYLAS